MKKGLAVITILALLVCALGASAQEEGSAEPQVFTSGDYEYILLDDGSAEITRPNRRLYRLQHRDRRFFP